MRAIDVLADDGPGQIARLRRSVAGEVAVAGAVLAATAVLVVTVPGRAATASHGMNMSMPMTMDMAPATASVVLPTRVQVAFRVDPPLSGSPDIAITLSSPGGRAVDAAQVDLTAALPEQGIDAITLRAARVRAGLYVVRNAPLPYPGRWRFTVTVRTSSVDSGVGQVTLPLQ